MDYVNSSAVSGSDEFELAKEDLNATHKHPFACRQPPSWMCSHRSTFLFKEGSRGPPSCPLLGAPSDAKTQRKKSRSSNSKKVSSIIMRVPFLSPSPSKYRISQPRLNKVPRLGLSPLKILYSTMFETRSSHHWHLCRQVGSTAEGC